jgi:undecaprenyl diphosphate synthase
MIHWLYERHLRRSIHFLPENIAIMIDDQDMTDAPEKIIEVINWCNDLGIKLVTFHISTHNPGSSELLLHQIKRIAQIARLTLHSGNSVQVDGSGMDVMVAIGMSGRVEITECIRSMARDRVRPEEVDERLIESYLTFKYEPDLVIKTGGNHLTDFLIWQSVYSELFFSDVNWSYFRKTDFLRALRDYQYRKRRFGK